MGGLGMIRLKYVHAFRDRGVARVTIFVDTALGPPCPACQDPTNSWLRTALS